MKSFGIIWLHVWNHEILYNFVLDITATYSDNLFRWSEIQNASHPEKTPMYPTALEKYSGDIINKTRTSNVGAISKAQKAQNNFLEKIEFFFLQKKVA